MSDSKKGTLTTTKETKHIFKDLFFLDQTDSTTAAQTSAAAPKPTNKIELGLLEEDDEFEEFETEDWQQDEKEGADQKDVNLWEDNWDDDNIEDDFTIQLR